MTVDEANAFYVILITKDPLSATLKYPKLRLILYHEISQKTKSHWAPTPDLFHYTIIFLSRYIAFTLLYVHPFFSIRM